MRVTVDPSQMADTSVPLRQASESARGLHRGTFGLVGHAEYAGDPELTAAIGDFLNAWGTTLDAVATHGETLARMLDLAGAAYSDADDRVRRTHVIQSADLQ